MTPTPTSGICALSGTPDPKCAGETGYFCDDGHILACHHGYAAERYPCATGTRCVNTPTPSGVDCK